MPSGTWARAQTNLKHHMSSGNWTARRPKIDHIGVCFFCKRSFAQLVLDFNAELFNGTNTAQDLSTTEVTLPSEDEVNELMESRPRPARGTYMCALARLTRASRKSLHQLFPNHESSE
ncbi:uncharacterized protein VP01_1441g6 [Puccinia sorghi]|uniref:Uncharacterized protein n=1 Tax=Puccinia sorghi TaxID=27349 RepID=A0A0L6VK87_9BASI|nr:uncharacterized protein VP01_1441g6 [Puccinia sorghi]